MGGGWGATWQGDGVWYAGHWMMRLEGERRRGDGTGSGVCVWAIPRRDEHIAGRTRRGAGRVAKVHAGQSGEFEVTQAATAEGLCTCAHGGCRARTSAGVEADPHPSSYHVCEPSVPWPRSRAAPRQGACGITRQSCVDEIELEHRPDSRLCAYRSAPSVSLSMVCVGLVCGPSYKLGPSGSARSNDATGGDRARGQ